MSRSNALEILIEEIKKDVVAEVLSKVERFERDPNSIISTRQASALFNIPNKEIIKDILVEYEVSFNSIPVRGGKITQVFQYGEFAKALRKDISSNGFSRKSRKYSKLSLATDSIPTPGLSSGGLNALIDSKRKEVKSDDGIRCINKRSKKKDRDTSPAQWPSDSKNHSH